MQPGCRTTNADDPSLTMLPPLSSITESDSTVWAPLAKGGPNGMVSLLTLMVWWGRALRNRTTYQQDSSAKWKATVLDITDVLQKLASLSTQLFTSKDCNGKRSVLPIENFDDPWLT